MVQCKCRCSSLWTMWKHHAQCKCILHSASASAHPCGQCGGIWTREVEPRKHFHTTAHIFWGMVPWFPVIRMHGGFPFSPTASINTIAPHLYIQDLPRDFRARKWWFHYACFGSFDIAKKQWLIFCHFNSIASHIPGFQVLSYKCIWRGLWQGWAGFPCQINTW